MAEHPPHQKGSNHKDPTAIKLAFERAEDEKKAVAREIAEKAFVELAKKEEPFDPHSVASAMTVEEQLRAEEMRELLAAGGVIPQESVRMPDIDISSGIRAPQYGLESDKNDQEETDDFITDSYASPEFDELYELYGQRIPSPEVLIAYKKLKNPEERKIYLEELRAGEEERKRQQAFTALEEKNAPGKREVERFFSDDERDATIADLSKNFHDIDFSKIDALNAAEARDALEADVQEQIDRNKKTRAREHVATNPEDALDQEHVQALVRGDHTPKELKQKLRELIGKFGEGAKGFSEHSTRFKEYLDNRAKEIDKSTEMSGGEKWMRVIGEKYNKLSLIHKLGIGATLGVGTVVGVSAMSLPLIVSGVIGLVGQRAVGAAGMFLSLEKKLQEKKLGESFQFMGIKERAALDAMLYTAVMGTAINQSIEFAREHGFFEQTREWLGSVFGHQRVEAPARAPAAPAAPTATVPEAVAPAMVEMPTVKASAGHGYEYMMKRLWEDLHAKGIELPANANPDSDLARLIRADKDTIDDLVHTIAADSRHQFFRADGSSVLITPDSQMTIGSRGELFLSDAGRELQVAPAHIATTPAASVAPHIESPMVTPSELDPYFVPPHTEPSAPTAATYDSFGTQLVTPQEVNPLTGFVNEQIPAPVETMMPRAVPEQVISPEPIKTVDLTPAQNTAETLTPVSETGIQEAFTNIYGTPINPNAPAIYEARTSLGEKILVAYGGNDESRFNFMQKFLQNPANQGKSIRWTHSVPSIMGPRIQVDELGAQTTAGRTSWFPSFFSRPVEFPDPKSFEKLVTK